MSFDNDTMILTHLVTFPSVWLPPPNAIKVMVLGATEENIKHLMDAAQDSYPTLNWCFYYVPDLDVNNQEHLDWTLINCLHMDGKVSYVQTMTDLAWSESIPDVHLINYKCPLALSKLLSAKNRFCQEAIYTLYLILNQTGKLPTT